jgi:phytoene dehydrogenase-like protein
VSQAAQISQIASASRAQRRRAHAPVPDSVDVAIIGAGLGGLVAGAYLAREGLRVAIFEQHYVAGGCATHFERGPKRARYRFDVGLHYIGDCGPGGAIPRMLRGVGIDLSYSPLDPDGFDTLLFPDLEFRIPASVDEYRDRLVALAPKERRGIDRYVKLLRAVMKAGRLLDQKDGRFSLRIALALAMDALRLAGLEGKTIAEVMDGCGLRDPRLRAVLLGQSGDYGLPPSQVSAFLHLGLSGHYFRGAYYPKGGGQTIADRLSESIEAAGGTVHLRRGVEKILVDGAGHATGLRLEPKAGEPARDVRARVVLSNADLSATMLNLLGPEHLSSSEVSRAKGYKQAAALFLTFVGVEGDMREKGMRAANYWQFDDFDMERPYTYPVDMRGFRARGSYITSATMKDPENSSFHAPAGITNLEVMTLVPGDAKLWCSDPQHASSWSYHDDPVYRGIKADLENQMIERLDQVFPGAASRVVFRESSTPLSHIRYTRAPGGTGYGIAATPDQFMKNRPSYRTRVPGLYVCGASTRAGHGIVGAMASGRQSALRIAKDLGRPLQAMAD